MLRINNFILIISFFVLLIAFFNRNKLSSNLIILPELNNEPKQTLTHMQAFTTVYNEETFEITPKYSYEIYGLVVSYRLHDSEFGQMIHALSNDHINVADYCVVWGTAANQDLLPEFEFSSGQFTCFWQTKNKTAWQQFNQSQISNNHILATDESIREIINEIKIGDQIYLRGTLADYKTTQFERLTSTVRTDTGNGACETVLVDEIKILSSMKSVWRMLMWLSLGFLLLTLFIYLKSPYEPHKRFH